VEQEMSELNDFVQVDRTIKWKKKVLGLLASKNPNVLSLSCSPFNFPRSSLFHYIIGQFAQGNVEKGKKS